MYKVIILSVLVAAAFGESSGKSGETSQSVAAPLGLQVNAGQQVGPEARQISGQGTFGNLGGQQSGSVFPYNMYQSAVMGGQGQTPSSASSWLSLLRPQQGGRRSSLTSRLRNIMSAIFRREQNSPYLAQGSSLSYALRPAPLGFGAASLGSGLSGLTSGFASSLGSGLGSLGSGFGLGSLGSGSSNNQQLLAAASAYQPYVLPSGQVLSSGSSGNSVSGSSGSLASLGSSLSQALGSGYNNAWSSGNTGSLGSLGSSSGSVPSYYGSNNGQSGSYQASVASPSQYQVAASAYNPAQTGLYSYNAGSGSSGSGNSYQRSSSSSFKPIVSSASYSNGLIASASAPAPQIANKQSASVSYSSQQ